MPDPFDFLSTRLNPEVSIFQQDRLNLLPSTPADFRRSDGTSNPVSVFDVLENRLQNLPNNLPAYQYGTKEERRYNNPYLQYTPENILGTDTEDIYGRFQGPGEQLWNSIVKLGANIAGTFGSSFADIPRQLDAIRSGDFSKLDFEEGKAFEHVQDWLTALEDKFPNYYTSLERNRSDWYNAFSPTGGMNFWGDKVIKNIGFSLGGLASGLVVDAALELASGGTATPVTYIAAANQFSKFYKNLFRGFRNLIKGGEQIDNVIDIAKATGSLARGLEVSNLSRLGTIGRYAATSYLSAQGEAFIEGYHTYIDTKRQLLEEAIGRGEVDSETLRDIEDRAQKAGKYTAGMNIPILIASNFIQFPNLLAGKSMLSPVNQFIKNEIGEAGIKAVSQFNTKNALKAWAKETFTDVFTEGFEEGAQYHISNSLHDYYADRLNPKIKEGMLSFLVDNIPETLTDSQFWSEATIGGISGALMGQIHSAQVFGQRGSTDEIVNRLNSSYERFNSLAKQYAKSIDLNTLENERDLQISTNDALFAAVHDSLKYGTYDTFMDSLKDLKDLDLDQYNKAFGTEFKTEDERNVAVDNIIGDAYAIEQSVLKVNQFYPKNPYAKPYLLDKIKKAFSPKSETELNTIQQNLFNDFKEVVARNQFLLKKTEGKILEHKDNLKTFGVKDEAISYIASLNTSKKGIVSYLKWKESQIKDLQRQADYYDQLSKADTTLTPDLNPKEEHAKFKKLADKTLTYYGVIEDLYKAIQEKPEDKHLKDLLLTLVLNEETTQEQVDRFVENRKKEAEELQKKQKDAEVLGEEEKDLAGENSKTAEEIIEANKNASEEAIPTPDNTPVPKPKEDPNKWLNKINIGDKTKKGYTIISKETDHVIAQDDLGNQYKITKEGNKFKEEPYGITSVPEVEETSNVQQDADAFFQNTVNDAAKYQKEYASYFTLKEDDPDKLESVNVTGIIKLLNRIKEEYNLPIKSIERIPNHFKVKIILNDGHVIEFGSILGGSIGNNLTLEQRVDNIKGLVAEIINHYRNDSSVLKSMLERKEPVQEEMSQSESNIDKINKINLERNKELVKARPKNLDLDQDGNLIEKDSGAKHSLDFEGVFSGGINKTYQQVYDALVNNNTIVGGLVSKEVYMMRPFYEKGLIKSKVDVYSRLNEPAINKKYDDMIDQLSQSEQPSPVEEVQPVQPTIEENREFTVGEEEFTTEELFNYPNAKWIKSNMALANGNWIYSVEDGVMYKRKLLQNEKGQVSIGNRSRLKASNVTELGNFHIYPEDRFRQLLDGEEEPIVREKKIDQTDKNLDEFLGEYIALKPIFKKQIDRGKFELIC